MEEKNRIYNAIPDDGKGFTPQAERLPSLPFCIAMDLVGMASYIFPGLGESVDVIWAPISSYIFMKSFGGMTGKIGAIINFIEEALPGTDIIPTFTIGYFYTKHQMKKQTKQES